jgi:hypothetical protein
MPPRHPRVAEEEETFDLEVSASSEEEIAAPKKGRAPRRAAPVPGPETEMTVVNPIAKQAARSNRALDVDLIFQRGKPNPSICKYCR